MDVSELSFKLRDYMLNIEKYLKNLSQESKSTAKELRTLIESITGHGPRRRRRQAGESRHGGGDDTLPGQLLTPEEMLDLDGEVV